ncbi:serine protease snake-like [Topomyia yanbarensis]|uniref:serine protease snake-like n=1 Tax=Topomyia yanbarensis TaxID=2498891 RepID=UPI00273C5736|nr:serine protease snake-like [Topomyia yanbarensis]
MVVEGRKISVLVTVLAFLAVTEGEDNAFVDDPPDGYWQRSSLDDCPSLFYSDDVSSALGFYILGGLRAFRSEFPHMAAIGWINKDTDRIEYSCGGSLISARFVVTAGHCGLNDDRVPPNIVRLGDTDLSSKEDDIYAQNIRIKKFIHHPNYKRSQKYYDIALIELEQDAKLDFTVCPICLWPHDNLNTFSGGLQVVGFGITEYGSDSSPTLQKATLNYWDYDTCNTMLPRPKSLFRGLANDQFCTRTPTKDTCQGDSGGPIQIELSDVNKVIPYLVGVTSFGTGCWEGSFGVYTKISKYIDWIRTMVNVTVDPIVYSRMRTQVRMSFVEEIFGQ